MPRQPRLDAPDTLHHVMVRGLERRAIFKDDADRADFVARLCCGTLLTQWTHGCAALATAFAFLNVETPRWRAVSAKASPN